MLSVDCMNSFVFGGLTSGSSTSGTVFAELNQEERLVGELARLQTIMMIFESKEEYEKAAMILKKIDKINEKLNNGSGKY